MEVTRERPGPDNLLTTKAIIQRAPKKPALLGSRRFKMYLIITDVSLIRIGWAAIIDAANYDGKFAAVRGIIYGVRSWTQHFLI